MPGGSDDDDDGLVMYQRYYQQRHDLDRQRERCYELPRAPLPTPRPYVPGTLPRYASVETSAPEAEQAARRAAAAIAAIDVHHLQIQRARDIGDFAGSARLEAEAIAALAEAEASLALLDREDLAKSSLLRARSSSTRSRVECVRRELAPYLAPEQAIARASSWLASELGIGADKARIDGELIALITKIDGHHDRAAIVGHARVYLERGDHLTPALLETLAYDAVETARHQRSEVAPDASSSPDSGTPERSDADIAAATQPDWQADVAAVAPVLGLGAVEVRSDATAREVVERERARGVAHGGVVHVDRDRVRPGTAEAREVLAHELVHLAQARLPVTADAGRAAAEHEAASIARAITRGEPARRPQHYIDLGRPAADSHAASDGIADPSPGATYLRLRLDDIVDGAVEELPYQPGTVDGLTYDGPGIAHYLQARIRSHVDDRGESGLAALVAPFDLELVVAGMADLYAHDVMSPLALERVTDVVGAQLTTSVCDAFARIGPRLVAAARAAGGTAALTSTAVPCDGHMDVLVRDALLRPRLASVQLSPDDLRRAEAEHKATMNERARAAKLSAAGAAHLLDATAARIQAVGDRLTPWGEPIAEATRDWIDQQRYWIYGESDEKLAELGPVLAAGAQTVAAAQAGIDKISASYPVPAAGPDSVEAQPIRRVLHLYRRAIEAAHGAGAGAELLARADQASRMLPLDLLQASVRDQRDSTEMVEREARTAGRRTERLADAPSYARDARTKQRALDAELRAARQRVVAGEGLDLDATAELATTAGEQAIANRFEAIEIKAQTVILEASRAGAKDAVSRVVDFVGRPVHRIGAAYQLAQVHADAWFTDQARSPQAEQHYRDLRQASVDAATAALAALAADAKLQTQFERALEEIHDARVRDALFDLAAMLMITLATGQIGSAAGAAVRSAYLVNAARGALVAERTAAVLEVGATLVVDSTLTTGALRATGEGGGTFGGDLVTNAMTLAVLRPFAALAKDIDLVEAATKPTWVRRGARCAIHGTIGSLEIVAAMATDYAVRQARAGAASEHAQLSLEQAASMALANYLSGRLSAFTARIHALGDDVGRALGTRLARARKLAASAERSGSPEGLARAASAYRDLLDAEHAVHADRAAAGLTVGAEQVAANQADAAAFTPDRIAMLRWRARGLEPLSADGSLWLGSRSELEAAIADAGPAAAATVVREADGRVRLRIVDQEVVLVPRGGGAPAPIDSDTDTPTVRQPAARPKAPGDVSEWEPVLRQLAESAANEPASAEAIATQRAAQDKIAGLKRELAAAPRGERFRISTQIDRVAKAAVEEMVAAVHPPARGSSSAELACVPGLGEFNGTARTAGTLEAKRLRSVVVNEVALVAPPGTKVIDQTTLEIQTDGATARVTIGIGSPDQGGHAAWFERTAEGNYRLAVSNRIADEDVTRALAHEMVLVRRDLETRTGQASDPSRPPALIEGRAAELRVLFAEADRTGTRGGEGVDSTAPIADVDAILGELRIDKTALGLARLRDVLAFDPALTHRVEMHLSGFASRPIVDRMTDLAAFAVQRQAHLDALATHLTGPNAAVAVEIEGLALDAQVRLEQGHRIFDGTTRAKARRGSAEESAINAHRAAMVSTLNDMSLSPEQRRTRLEAEIQQLAADTAIPASLRDKIDFAAIKQAIDAYGTTGHGGGAMTLDVATGEVTLPAAAGDRAPTTMRELMRKVDAANEAARANGLAIDYVLIVHRPATTASGRELACVEILARRRPQSRVQSVPGPTLAPNNGQGDLIVDVGVGRGGFAAEQTTPTPGGLIVQTDYIGNAEVGQISRPAPGIADAGPVGAEGSVMVFTDFLMRPDLFRGTSAEAGTAGIRQVFINNVSADFKPRDYWELADQLAANMADGGTVEVQWTMSPESPGGKPGSRNHIRGDRLVDYLDGTKRPFTQETLPVVGEDFTIDAATKATADPDRVAEYTAPVPERRIVITFHGAPIDAVTGERTTP